MKILDRYLFRQMMFPFIACLSAFAMIYVVIDLFSHFGDFMQGQAGVMEVFRYYILLIPASLTYLVPASLIMAELYCLSKLSRNSELTAMRASGLSLPRLMTPLMGIGFAASALVLGINESMGPHAAYQTAQFVRAQRQEGKARRLGTLPHDGEAVDVFRYETLVYYNRMQQRRWLIGEFNARTFEMKNAVVHQQDEQGMDRFKLTSPRVEWLDGRWWFHDLQIQFYDEANSPRGAPRMEKGMEIPEFNESPRDFLNEALEPEYLGARHLARYIRRNGHLSGPTLTRYRVDFHYRLAMPWSCFVVSLLGLPLGSHTGRRGAMKGIFGCLALFFATYVLISIGLHAGKEEWIPAWAAGWGPLLLIGLYGQAMLVRMR